MWMAEWSLHTAKHTAYFVPESDLKELIGHESVYRFSEEAAKIMRDVGTVTGISNYVAYTDRFIIDLDDGDKSIALVLRQLRAKGLGYKVYKSGGKGYHIVVKTVPMEGLDVPYSQRKFAETIEGIHDFNVYRHNSLIRLPGTVHQKTGNEKILVKEVKGKLLDIPYQNDPSRYVLWDIENVLPSNKLDLGFRKLSRLISDPPEIGNRHIQVWSACQTLADSGLGYETVLDLLLNINSLWGKTSKDDYEIKGIVNDVFKVQEDYGTLDF